MRKLGIAGTAKNTGKTTTLNVLLAHLCAAKERRVALTSIGYDGETLDNVTGMPKPRILVQPGTFVATAAQCVRTGDAGLRVVEDTQVETPLGPVLLCEVETAGRIVLAGPSRQGTLMAVLASMEAHDADIAIVDGALSRIAPFSLMDGILLATGAARTTDIARLAQETGSILSLLATDVLAPVGRVQHVSSILHQGALDAFLACITEADTVCINGVVAEELLLSLPLYKEALYGKRLLLPDPTKLLLASDVPAQARCIQTLAAHNVTFGVQKPLQALAVTVNPYYPLYRYSSKEYSPAYVERPALRGQIEAAAAPTPCFDVLDGGAPVLLETIEAWLCNPVVHAARI